MRYMVRKSIIDVLGHIWQPGCDLCSLRLTPDRFDLDNMRDEHGRLTRHSVGEWLMTHTGDFASISDWSASLEDGEQTIDLPWSSEETELQYLDTVAEPEVDHAG